MSIESGGVRTVLLNLDKYINKANSKSSHIITNKKEKDDPYIEFPSQVFKPWCFSNKLQPYLKTNIADINAMHLHGVFMHSQYLASKIAIKHKIPYVTSPHGMLEPWHLNDKKFKKKLYLKFILENILSNSNIIHAITPLEKENIFKLTDHKNIIEIPNFIFHSELPKNQEYNPKEEYLLFLSRIHPKKGLDILLQAMTLIIDKKIKLKVVGSENKYSLELQVMAQKLGIASRIEFVGSVFGAEKFNLFANAKVFIAPSYSEAIGMVNLEAAVCTTPVITTFNTGINPEWSRNGGIMIQPNVEELSAAINQAVSWTLEERKDRGKKLSEFVINNYSWEKKGFMWDELYDELPP